MLYIVPTHNIGHLTEGIAKLNKRCKRMKLPLITIDVLGVHKVLLEYYVGEQRKFAVAVPPNGHATGAVVELMEVVVQGNAPVFEGWELTGVLEPVETEDGWENMLKSVPGKCIPSQYRTFVHKCEHCNTKRRRKETFVVRHVEENRFMCVGRSCLKDFLGHTDPAQLARCAEYLLLLEEMCKEFNDGEWEPREGFVSQQYQLSHVIDATGFIISKHGWKSKTAAQYGGQSTASLVSWLITPQTFFGPDAGRQRVEHENACAEFAAYREGTTTRTADAIKWARELDGTDSDYLGNLSLACRALAIQTKQFGIVCSLLPAYDRAMGVVEEKKDKLQEQKDKLQEHFGEVGTKERLTLTIKKLVDCDGFYSSVLHCMEDAEGRSFKWFRSGVNAIADVGDTITINAKIKAHENYKGVPETMLSHCRLAKEVKHA